MASPSWLATASLQFGQPRASVANPITSNKASQGIIRRIIRMDEALSLP
jgi:hypothetical protein